MAEMIERLDSKRHLRRILCSPEGIIVLIVTCGFLTNVQRAYDTESVLRSNPLAFKGIRILTMVIAQLLAVSTILRRKVPLHLCVETATLSLVLCLCCCVLSIPFSCYPLLSMFKTSEIGLVVLICAIGISSVASKPADLFNLNIMIVLMYNIVIWVEGILFPGLAWIKIEGETPLFTCALSGVFPIINANTVGLFGAVLFLAYFPQLFEADGPRLGHLLPCVIGLASVVCSYSRISLLGVAVTMMCVLALLQKYMWVLAITLCVFLVGINERVRTTSVDHFARGREERSLDELSSHRLEMWNYILDEYGASLSGRGYAAGFRYDKHFSAGHAHNSFFELYFNVGVLGLLAWLFMIATVFNNLFKFLRAQPVIDCQLVSIIGVTIFLCFKALASTVFVYLDMSMLILAGVIVYIVKRHIANQCAVGEMTIPPAPVFPDVVRDSVRMTPGDTERAI